MALAALEAAVGLVLDQIAEFAAANLELLSVLREAREAAKPRGVYFKFQAIERALHPSMSFTDVSEAFKAAKYYSRIGYFLGMLGEDEAIPTGLARALRVGPGEVQPEGTFLYRVRIMVTSDLKGYHRNHNEEYYSDVPLTPREAEQAARAQFVERMDKKYVPEEDGGLIQGGTITTAVTDFARFFTE
jgi:hypothetical protein